MSTYLSLVVVDLLDRGSLRVLLEELDGLLDGLVKSLLIRSLEFVAVFGKLLLQTVY